jgi:hypothetical protein
MAVATVWREGGILRVVKAGAREQAEGIKGLTSCSLEAESPSIVYTPARDVLSSPDRTSGTYVVVCYLCCVVCCLSLLCSPFRVRKRKRCCVGGVSLSL